MGVSRAALALAMLTTAPWASPPAPAHAQQAELHRMEARTRPITRFRIGSDETRFGDLEFAGGLEINATSRHFGALSGFRFVDGQGRFIGVTDTGFWVDGTLARGEDGNPAGVTDLAMTAIAGRGGAPITGKWQADAEGIAARDGTLWVSFEREHRIAVYETDGEKRRWKAAAPPPVPLHELRRNRGFEGIAIGTEASALAGALIGVTENSLDAAGNIMAFARPGTGEPFEFSVAKRDDFYVTDIDFLPDGDLILLERRFNVRDGVAMRLRRIDDAEIRARATVDGEILLEVDMRFQIDNMEGLAITQDADGVPRLTIVSDDNHSILQRNLLIEFRYLTPPADAVGG
ncbi:esterase-like activity of phytase family protein [Oceaniradius stylonematis]|uniref:esterase-like activity of phytase family protein n=1 Tax=Oceaniradius stylonematis TaxID=2184161 RepID=UPI00273FE00C|nr:esterase-like activity of phytase family protein [Oceaniradius stylonematis]